MKYYTKDDLTKEELSELRDEVIVELNGNIVLDGILFSISPFRNLMKE